MSRLLNRAPQGAGLVYVVDDEAAVRKALSLLIRSAGLEVITFASASAFMEHPRADRPACLVLDVRLAGSSGLDLQSTLGETRHSLPIVFLTGYGDVPMTVRAMKGGALDVLLKPCDDRELLAAIERALARSRAALADSAERRALEQRIPSLTPREREVLALVVTGRLNKQIAAELGNAEKTVKIHRGRMMRKMEADSVAELVRMTQKAGLSIPPEPRTGTHG
jgi:FixJ family two-component response regulator